VSTWSLHVFSHEEIAKGVAQVDDTTTTVVADRIHELTRVL
jgi:hypothetical protein